MTTKFTVAISLLVILFGCDNQTSSKSCGDNIIDVGEECDGTNFGEYGSCNEVGLYGGSLACSSTCTIDTSGCGTEGSCGDDLIQAAFGEECDMANLDGNTCISLGHEGGTLACSNDCTFDRSGCEGETLCGDGEIQSPEECDGDNLNETTCESIGGYEGSIACNLNCTLNLSECAYCGNDIIETAHGEECDTNQVLSCHSLEEGFGMPECDMCQLDITPCHAAQTVGGMGPELSWAAAVSEDAIYVAGISYGGWGGLVGPSAHQFLTKTDQMGATVWTADLMVSDNPYPPVGVKLTSVGDVVVGGPIVPEGAPSGTYLRKFDSDGNLLWAHSMTHSLTDSYYGAFHVDSDDNIWWSNLKMTDGVVAIEHRSTDGTPIESFSFPVSGVAMVTQILETSEGDLIIIGDTVGDISGVSFSPPTDCGDSSTEQCTAPFIVSMTKSGTVNWAAVHDPNGSIMLSGARGTIAGTQIVVCGTTDGAFDGEVLEGGTDLFCLWYSQDGTHQNTQLYGTSGNDTFGGVFTSASGEVVIAANSRNSLFGQSTYGNDDIYLTTLTATGQPNSSTSIGSDTVDVSTLLVPRPNGEEFYVIGYSLGNWGDLINQGNEDLLIHYMSIQGF